MSWSKTFKWENGSLNENSPTAVLSEDSLDQLSALKEAVTDIILSGAVGDVGETYVVSVGGHANPGHEKTPGWSNDSISINIYQM